MYAEVSKLDKTNSPGAVPKQSNADDVITVFCTLAAPSETASNDDASQMLTAASLKPLWPCLQALDLAANRLGARANLYLVPPKLANCDLAAKTMCELVKGIWHLMQEQV